LVFGFQSLASYLKFGNSTQSITKYLVHDFNCDHAGRVAVLLFHP